MFLRQMHNYLHSDSLRETKSVNLNFLLFIIHIMKLLSKPLVYFFGFSVLILNEFLWGWIRNVVFDPCKTFVTATCVVLSFRSKI